MKYNIMVKKKEIERDNSRAKMKRSISSLTIETH